MGKSLLIRGKTFNYLTAVQHAGGKKWIFRCVCGFEGAMWTNNVTRGATKSCGCMKEKLIAERQILPNNQGIFNNAFHIHKQAAARRGIPAFLTRDQYIEIIKKPCHYCGGFSTRSTQKSKRVTVLANSVDRRNNEPYYKPENTVPACFTCQAMKSDFSEDTFLAQAAKIAAWSRR